LVITINVSANSRGLSYLEEEFGHDDEEEDEKAPAEEPAAAPRGDLNERVGEVENLLR
jgi:hypothetical protein